jgi:hypothetical protein
MRPPVLVCAIWFSWAAGESVYGSSGGLLFIEKLRSCGLQIDLRSIQTRVVRGQLEFVRRTPDQTFAGLCLGQANCSGAHFPRHGLEGCGGAIDSTGQGLNRVT